MNKNNKGFTMIELLGAMVILSVISIIGVASMGRYLKQSKDRAYKMLSQSVYEAYENCAIETECYLPESGTITVNWDEIRKLVTDGYLDNLKSPGKKELDCTNGTIRITAEANSDSNMVEYKKYAYNVSLTCPGVTTKEYEWPREKGEAK